VSRFTVLVALAGAAWTVCTPASAAEEAPTRSLRLSARVEAPAAVLYEVFATSDGVRSLFPGATASIGNAVGEEYRVAFDPANSPDGSENGTAGCRILRLDPGVGLAFEWRGPPWALAMNALPLPTWVDVSFVPEPGGTVTRVDLEHHGFGRGAEWDRAYEFFAAAWRRTLDGLIQRFAEAREEGLR
jgi:uncharacterized protein YndB with AHSA1/START domain